MENRVGFNDAAAENDSLGMEKYETGLADFIRRCNTPMTISIQGEWGTGKSSLMKRVEKDVLENADTAGKIYWINFNTWTFSQFGMDENLPTVFISRLTDELEKSGTAKDAPEEKESYRKLKEILGIAARDATNIMLDRVKAATGIDLQKTKDDIAAVLCEKTNAVNNIRDTFQKCVNEKLGVTEDTPEDGFEGKLVIFIDDLDRLVPEKAIELLETIKIFCDCKHCVFILAVDTEVVTRGIRKKYGDDFGNDKGRSFFEKMIQVPFNMPESDYNISEFVRTSFEPMIPMTNEELSNITGLIELSVGSNPRRIKRMVNAFTLLYIVEKQDDTPEDAHFRQCMLASLCMQQAFEKLYHQLIRHEDILYEDVCDFCMPQKTARTKKGTAGSKEEAENQEVPNKLELCLTEAGLTENERQKDRAFLSRLLKIVRDEKSWDLFRECLGLSSLTDADTKINKKSVTEDEVFDKAGCTPELLAFFSALDRAFMNFPKDRRVGNAMASKLGKGVSDMARYTIRRENVLSFPGFTYYCTINGNNTQKKKFAEIILNKGTLTVNYGASIPKNAEDKAQETRKEIEEAMQLRENGAAFSIHAKAGQQAGISGLSAEDKKYTEKITGLFVHVFTDAVAVVG